MYTIRILLALGVIVLLSAIDTRAQTDASPSAVTDSFYKKYVAYQMRGLPSEKQVKALAPLFSKDITAMIAADRVEQSKFIKGHPGEKPPWVEAICSRVFTRVEPHTRLENRAFRKRKRKWMCIWSTKIKATLPSGWTPLCARK
jgi:hypothetical protein